MKKIILLFGLVFILAFIGHAQYRPSPDTVGINIPGPVVPYASSDAFPTHYTNYGKGGFHNVTKFTDRENIPAARRLVGMYCYVADSNKTYQLQGGIANTNWKEISLPLTGALNGQTLRYKGGLKKWSASSFLYNNDSAIGIGTTEPVNTLTIVKNVAPGTGALVYSTGNFVDIRNNNVSTNALSGIRFAASTSDAGTYKAGIFFKRGSDLRGDIIFATSRKSTSGNATAIDTNARMVITSYGNVGIGTVSPSAKLSVSGIVHVSGNVGIGVTNPTVHLGFSALSTGSIPYTALPRTIGVERALSGVGMWARSGSPLIINAGGAASGNTDYSGGYLSLSSGIATGSGSSYIEFLTATAGSSGSADRVPTVKMTIAGNGNVGIGTTSTAAKLNVYNSGESNPLINLRDKVYLEADNDNDLRVVSTSDGAMGGIRFGNSDGFMQTLGVFATGSWSDAYMGVNTKDSKGTLVIMNSGVMSLAFGNATVGIGRPSPRAQLDFAGIPLDTTMSSGMILPNSKVEYFNGENESDPVNRSYPFNPYEGHMIWDIVKKSVKVFNGRYWVEMHKGWTTIMYLAGPLIGSPNSHNGKFGDEGESAWTVSQKANDHCETYNFFQYYTYADKISYFKALLSYTSTYDLESAGSSYVYSTSSEIYWWHKSKGKALYIAAYDWADLMDGEIVYSREKGTGINGKKHWTGSGSNGAVTNNCDMWRKSSGAVGRTGSYTATNGAWLSNEDINCTETRYVICFAKASL